MKSSRFYGVIDIVGFATLQITLYFILYFFFLYFIYLLHFFLIIQTLFKLAKLMGTIGEGQDMGNL